tara:strand:+ start:307 stop:525 length:219 start_codon:yes stop_codon:yes gene_type:complete
MITKRAIYQEGEALAILCPSNDSDIMSICKKDIPKGKKFKILNVSDFPSDSTFRYAWEYDLENDYDGVGEAE